MFNKKNSKLIYKILTVLFVLLFGSIITLFSDRFYQKININPITAEESQNVELVGENILQIHFFDVGQADSILLISNNKTMLIDAGTNDMREKGC